MSTPIPAFVSQIFASGEQVTVGGGSTQGLNTRFWYYLVSETSDGVNRQSLLFQLRQMLEASLAGTTWTVVLGPTFKVSLSHDNASSRTVTFSASFATALGFASASFAVATGTTVTADYPSYWWWSPDMPISGTGPVPFDPSQDIGIPAVDGASQRSSDSTPAYISGTRDYTADIKFTSLPYMYKVRAQAGHTNEDFETWWTQGPAKGRRFLMWRARDDALGSDAPTTTSSDTQLAVEYTPREEFRSKLTVAPSFPPNTVYWDVTINAFANPGGETLACCGKVGISSSDTTYDYLGSKVSSSDSSITFSTTNPAANEILDIVVTTNGISNSKIRQSAGLSVIGRSANSTGNVADITAASDGDVLRLSGTTLGFGTLVIGSLPTSSSLGTGPTALGTAGTAITVARSDQTHAAYRSDLPLSTTWVIDPVNGSDSSSNGGTTSATALKTLAELSRRWWGAEIRSNTTISILGNIPSNDNPSWNFTTSGIAVVTFTGSLGSTTGFGGATIDNTLYTGTVTGFVAASATMANDDIELTDAAIPTSFTASGLMAAGVIFRRSGGSPVHWYALKDLTSKTIRITAPMLNSGVAMSASLTVTDGYSAYQMWTFPIMYFGMAAVRVAGDSLYQNTTGLNTFQMGFSIAPSRMWFANQSVPIMRNASMINCMFAPPSGSMTIVGAGNNHIAIIGGGAKGSGAQALQFTGGAYYFIQGSTVFQGIEVASADGAIVAIEIGSIAVHDTTTEMLSATFGARIMFLQSTANAGVSGKGNAGQILTVNTDGVCEYNLTGASPPFLSTTTSAGTPITIGSGSYTVAQLPAVADTRLMANTAFPSTVFETGGPTRLTWAGAADGLPISRSGATLIGTRISNAMFRQSTALTVVGRSANSTGDVADIAAGSDGDVLRRSGTTLGFGSIPEASVTNLNTDLAGKQPIFSFTNKSVLFSGGGSTVSEDNANFSFDTGSNVLTIAQVTIPAGGTSALQFTQAADQAVMKTGGKMSYQTLDAHDLIIGANFGTQLTAKSDATTVEVNDLFRFTATGTTAQKGDFAISTSTGRPHVWFAADTSVAVLPDVPYQLTYQFQDIVLTGSTSAYVSTAQNAAIYAIGSHPAIQYALGGFLAAGGSTNCTVTIAVNVTANGLAGGDSLAIRTIKNGTAGTLDFNMTSATATGAALVTATGVSIADTDLLGIVANWTVAGSATMNMTFVLSVFRTP